MYSMWRAGCSLWLTPFRRFAYVEFAEPEHVEAALALDNSMFHDRLIKACALPDSVGGHRADSFPAGYA